MQLCKIIILVILIVFAYSCKNCKGPYSPYIATFRLKNVRVDSIATVAIYFYSNNSTFNQAIDSIGISKRQYDADVDFEFVRKSDTLRTFIYKITYFDSTVKEFKIRLIEDGCENCNDCDERVYVKTIEINGVLKSNKGNVINLN
jgi:GH25 family lysozyme M1 (1,4-beta-N-acetylmuramidase)